MSHVEVSTYLSQIFWYTTIEIHASHCRASASVTVYIVHLYAECRKKSNMQEGINLSRERGERQRLARCGGRSRSV